MSVRRLARYPILLIAFALALGCDASSAFFSEADRRSIYTVAFSSDTGKLASGSSVLPGELISVSLTRMTGSSSPESLSLELLAKDGVTEAVLAYSTKKAAKSLESTGTAAATVDVESLTDKIPRFALPDTLVPGSYTLLSVLTDQFGVELQRSETVVFIGRPGFAASGLSFYPPNPAPGSSVLLSATITKSDAAGEKDAEADDPWLRWSSEGKSFALGPLSKGFAKVVWETPGVSGAYSVKLELFPSEPDSKSLAEASPWQEEIKVVVARPAVVYADLYAQSTRFLARLDFGGDFVNQGTKAQTEKTTTFGQPLLEAYAGGFGYRLDAGSGVSLPGFQFPSKDGLPVAFSLLWKYYSEEYSGDILAVRDAKTSVLFRVALEDGKPVAELRDGTGTHRSSADVHLVAGLHDIALSFEPEKDRFVLVWNIDGERYASPSLPALLLPEGASAMLGGGKSLSAVYDEFALSDDAEGQLPFFRAGAERHWRTDLQLGEGFEESELPETATFEGTSTLVPRAFTIKGIGSLSFLKDLSLSRPLAFDIDYAEKKGNLVAAIQSDGGPFISIAASGEIRLASGVILGLLRPTDDSRLAFTIKSTPDGVEVAAIGGLAAARVTVKQAPKNLRLSLENVTDDGNVVISAVLVRAAPELIGLGDSPRLARLF